MQDGLALSSDPPRAGRRGGGGVLARLLAIDPLEATFERRGFPSSPAQPRLEAAGAAFLSGYNLAAAGAAASDVMAALARAAPERRGFFAEGSTMGAAMRAALLPFGDPLTELMTALERHYVHLAHVGVGWATARLPFARRRLERRLDPMLAPLALDGRGFHDGYFQPGAIAAGRRRPAGEAGRVYDQGVGRSLWFSCAAEPRRIADHIGELPGERRGDLWAGAGLACVYAGGADRTGLDRLIQQAGAHRRWLRQGAAFGLGAHARSAQIPTHAVDAAETICGRAAAAIEDIVNSAFVGVAADRRPQPHRYQQWRRQVADSLEAGGTR